MWKSAAYDLVRRVAEYPASFMTIVAATTPMESGVAHGLPRGCHFSVKPFQIVAVRVEGTSDIKWSSNDDRNGVVLKQSPRSKGMGPDHLPAETRSAFREIIRRGVYWVKILLAGERISVLGGSEIGRNCLHFLQDSQRPRCN